MTSVHLGGHTLPLIMATGGHRPFLASPVTSDTTARPPVVDRSAGVQLMTWKMRASVHSKKQNLPRFYLGLQ